MSVKYVVSIAGELLYFNAQREPEAPFPATAEDPDNKPAIKLIEPKEKPAAQPEWDAQLSRFSAEQRNDAEISVSLDE